MEYNRKGRAILFLIVGLVASCSIFLVVPIHATSTQIGIGLGILLGISTSDIVEIKGDATRDENPKRDRWMVLLAVGGFILASFISIQFGENGQNFFTGLVFSWLIVFSFYTVYWALKHREA